MGGTSCQDGIYLADIPQTYEQIGITPSSIYPVGSHFFGGWWNSCPMFNLCYPNGKIPTHD
jgi:hypothetical protein